jgi:hypothetical protein
VETGDGEEERKVQASAAAPPCSILPRGCDPLLGSLAGSLADLPVAVPVVEIRKCKREKGICGLGERRMGNTLTGDEGIHPMRTDPAVSSPSTTSASWS